MWYISIAMLVYLSLIMNIKKKTDVIIHMAGNPRTKNGAKIIAVLGYLSAKIIELKGAFSH